MTNFWWFFTFSPEFNDCDYNPKQWLVLAVSTIQISNLQEGRRKTGNSSDSFLKVRSVKSVLRGLQVIT
jgi:hypothetical protein